MPNEPNVPSTNLFVSMEEIIGVAEIANNSVTKLISAGIPVHISIRKFLEVTTQKLIEINEISIQQENARQLAADKAARDEAIKEAVDRAEAEVAAIDSPDLSQKTKDKLIAEGGVPALVDRLNELKNKKDKPARVRHPKKTDSDGSGDAH